MRINRVPEGKKCCSKMNAEQMQDEYKTIKCSNCFEVISYEKIVSDPKPKQNKKETKKKDENKQKIKLSREEQKQNIDIKKTFTVKPIDQKFIHEWLTHKHYAHRVPPIMYSFALYKNDIIEGCCTYGLPARNFNNGDSVFGGSVEVKTIELNRLCVNDGLPRNTLSYFVSQTLLLLPKPMCIISYADSNNGHHGYIYQSTNWVYTGETSAQKIFTDTNNNKKIHARTLNGKNGSSSKKSLPENIVSEMEESGKYRYFKFVGNKKEINIMNKYFKYESLPYPKGDNKKYDNSYKIKTQQLQMF